MTMKTHHYGYAVPVLPSGKAGQFNLEDMPNEGLWRTELETKLLVSFTEFLAKVQKIDYYPGCVQYLFHSKNYVTHDVIEDIVTQKISHS